MISVAESEEHFVLSTSSVFQFMDVINKTSRCATVGCEGTLVPHQVDSVRLAVGLRCYFSCNGCIKHTVPFNSTMEVEHSRRTQISLDLQVAVVLSGGGYAMYQHLFGQCFGLKTVCSSNFDSIIHLLHAPVKLLLEEQVALALADIAVVNPCVIGGSARAVTTGGGFWLTQGSFSKNTTFHVRNYLTNEVIAFRHLCQATSPNEEGYQGTSKSAEGVGARTCFAELKNAGGHEELHWQDGNSSSEKAF